MDEMLQSGKVDGALLRRQPEDAVGFVRPVDPVYLEVAFPVADMRDALGFLQSGLAFSQVAKHQ